MAAFTSYTISTSTTSSTWNVPQQPTYQFKHIIETDAEAQWFMRQYHKCKSTQEFQTWMAQLSRYKTRNGHIV